MNDMKWIYRRYWDIKLINLRSIIRKVYVSMHHCRVSTIPPLALGNYSEGFYWSCDEPRNAAIVNVGGSLASVGEQVTVAAAGSSFGESCLLQAKAHALTAIAHQRTRLVAISRRDYERLIAERRARLHTEREI